MNPVENLTIPIIFYTSLMIGFSGALSPGPLLLLTIEETTKIGAKAGILISIGHALLELIVVIALYNGLNNFLDPENNLFIVIIGIIGGLVLIVMSKNLLLPTKEIIDDNLAKTNQNKRSIFIPILKGITVSLSNPFWTIWLLTIGMTYLVWARSLGPLGTISFYIGHISADFIALIIISLIIASGRKFINSKMYKYIMQLCGLFLLLLGIYFVYFGVKHFFL